MTFAADKNSVEDSAPREGVEIIFGPSIFRLALGELDVVINGNTYVSTTADHNEISVSVTGALHEMAILMPLSHPFAQRYFSLGLPPRGITATLRQLETRSGESVIVWQGLITSGGFTGHVAKFLVPSRLGESLKRKLPTITAGRACPHVLYDVNTCRADRAANTIRCEVVSVDGTIVVVDSIPSALPLKWAQWGSITHVNTGQRMTVFDSDHQVLVLVGSGTLTLQAPLQELQVGDLVDVAAGCNHLITDCHDRFDNQANYGGFNFMPTNGIFSPAGTGITESD